MSPDKMEVCCILLVKVDIHIIGKHLSNTKGEYLKGTYFDLEYLKNLHLQYKYTIVALALCQTWKVFYISSSFWLLGVESRDFSHAEKEWTACKAGQIHEMTIIFTQNCPML